MALDQSQVTPGRQTRLDIDIPDPVLTDPAITTRRQGSQVAADLVTGYQHEARSSNMKYWPSGCWTLDVVQSEITNIHEYIDTAHLVVPLAGFRLIELLDATAMIQVVNHWRMSSDLPGMVFNEGLIAKSGDPWMVKKIPSGQSVAGKPITSGVVTPTQVVTDIALDRCGESEAMYPADQGFFLRWTLPGTGKHHPAFVWSFYFGQYCLAIKGNGQCDLYEHCHDRNNVLQWRKRDTFRYARPSQISDASHTMLIWPHVGPNGEKFINFAGNQPDAAGYLAGYTSFDPSHVAPTHHVYRVDETKRSGDRDESPGHATKSDLIRFDMRRDLVKLEIQISTLGWAQSGFLVDQPGMDIPWYAAHTAQDLQIQLEADQGGSNSIGTQFLDADNSGSFDPAQTTHPLVKFVFQGDGTSSPRLWGYTLNRPQTIQAGTATPITTQVISASVSGFAGDGTEQSANVNVQDLTGAATRLRRRGRFAALLKTMFSPPDGSDPVWVPLLRGYIYRPQGELKGNRSWATQGLGGALGDAAPVGSAFPSADWSEYALPLVGMNLRLNERFNVSEIVNYAQDQTATVTVPFSRPPWLVTRAVRDLIGRAGFPASMINIADVPIRLWFGVTKNASELFSQPMTTYGEMAARLVRDYLGGYLFFDESAGTQGQWTILYGQQINPSGHPLLYFQRGTAGAGKLPHSPGSYPDNNSGPNPAPVTFVNSGIKSQPIPIEFNAVKVCCPSSTDDRQSQVLVTNYLANPKSFPVPGMPTIVPDPEGPDYIGYEKRLTVIDLACQSIAGQNGSILQRTQDNVNWKCRRLYDFCCHGLEGLGFEAPLIFIKDANTHKWRMPRFMDLAGYDGSNVLIRSCSPHYNHDTQQMAWYEIVHPST